MTALTLVVGAAEPLMVTVPMARRQVVYWQDCFDEAAAGLVTHVEGPARDEARRCFDAALTQLLAALNRRDRLICELQGVPWLHVAGEAADV